jgi:bacteriorhodopsin
MSNAPNWLWFLIAVLVILAVLWLIGIRVNVG